MSGHVNGWDDPGGKPRVRVAAGSSNDRVGNLTTDNISNFVARIGLGQQNLLSNSTHTFNPITRLNQLMEWAYRGSWIVGAAVDVVADDMTRAGITLNSDMDPDDVEKIHNEINEISLWQGLNETVKWSRLYGGCLMVFLIDGQDMQTPLVPESIAKGQLKGFLPLDRWMIQPSYNKLVQDYGPDYGLPEFYQVVANAPFMPKMTIHYSRCIRMDGVTLPFRQKLAENGWGMSVIERLYDRLLAFDSGTMGASELLFRAYLRVYKVEGFKQLVSMAGQPNVQPNGMPSPLQGFYQSMDMMRWLQSNNGMTVIDSKDEFEALSYSFAGVSDTLLVLGQQISGALGIPLVRLFGQSPAGRNSSGESDLRQYYDMILATQEARLRRPLTKLFDILHRSALGAEPPDTFGFKFNSLRQLDEMEKSELAQRDVATVAQAVEGGIISIQMALKELKQSSILTGRFTNITEEDMGAA